MRKSQFIIITGPESSGKSTLTNYLAKYYQMPMVDEVARQFLPGLGRPYNYSDLIEIARLEAVNLLNYRFAKAPVIFVDTWLVVMRIWMEVRYGKCEPWIRTLPELYSDAHYLLCTPDLPWEYDPLRENPDNRWELFEMYENVLNQHGLNYTIIEGVEQNRYDLALHATQPFLITAE